jgi:hypothetical protein
MARPKAMKLGLTRWRVEWGREALDRLLGPGSNDDGVCRPGLAAIAVETLPGNPIGERELLLHEVLHACVAASSLDVPLDQEEPLVAAIAPRLLEALRQNPALIRYLLDPQP